MEEKKAFSTQLAMKIKVRGVSTVQARKAVAHSSLLARARSFLLNFLTFQNVFIFIFISMKIRECAVVSVQYYGSGVESDLELFELVASGYTVGAQSIAPSLIGDNICEKNLNF